MENYFSSMIEQLLFSVTLLYILMILLLIGLCVILPIFLVRSIARKKINADNKRAEIITAVLEKNPDTDVEELLKKLERATPRKSLKRSLLQKQIWGSVSLVIGLPLLVFALLADYKGGVSSSLLHMYYLGSALLILTGLAFFLVFFINKRYLAQELKAEQQENTTQP